MMNFLVKLDPNVAKFLSKLDAHIEKRIRERLELLWTILWFIWQLTELSNR